ncbi:MAG: GTPase Era [Chitinophagales bacterium]
MSYQLLHPAKIKGLSCNCGCKDRHSGTENLKWPLPDNILIFGHGVLQRFCKHYRQAQRRQIDTHECVAGEKLSIITPKAQTTRRRILGIVNTDMHQVIFSDTPGIIDIPQYKLHEWMNAQIKTALQDADILLFMTSADDDIPAEHPMVQLLQKIHLPVCLVINKIDRTDGETLQKMVEAWRSRIPQAGIFPISALKKIHTETLYDHILSNLPEHPPYYETDALTDQTERALVSEMIREKYSLDIKKRSPILLKWLPKNIKTKAISLLSGA